MNTNRGSSPRTRQRAITLAIGVALAAIAAATRADVTIVSEVNVTGGMNRGAGGGRGFGGAAQQFPKTVSLYYKGDKARSEEKGGPVTIYDAAAGKIYTLDTAKKTYYEQSLADIASGAQRFARPGAEPPPPSKVTLKETGDTQTIAAKKAAKYSVDGSLSFGFGGGGFGRGGGGGFGAGGGFGGGQGRRSRGGDENGGPPPPGDDNGGPPGGGNFGGGPGGGGPPGGGAADDGQGGGNRRGRRAGGGGGFGAGMPPPTTKVTGALWFSDAVTLPAGKKATALPSAQLAAAGAPGLTQPLTEMLNKQGKLPLRSEITTTITFPARPNPNDDAGGAPPAPMEIKTVTTSVVKSISSKVLGAALFAVPAGYKKVDPPARGFGRGGRRGQGGAGDSQGGFGGGRRGGFGGGPGQDGGGRPMNGNDNGGGSPPMNGNDGGGFGPPPPMDGGDDGGGPPMDGGDFGPPPPMDGGDGGEG